MLTNVEKAAISRRRIPLAARTARRQMYVHEMDLDGDGKAPSGWFLSRAAFWSNL